MKILLLVVVPAVLAVVGTWYFVFVVQNVETPAYQVVEQDGAFEIRDYPPLVVAEVARGGSRRQGLRQGFGPLARYIFAKERGGGTIAMTAPVEQQARTESGAAPIAMTAPVLQTAAADEQWAVRFIMPARYRLEDLPAPAGDEVQLREFPPRRIAAVRFSGRTGDAQLATQEQALRQWLAARDLRPSGAPVYAYYNDPFTPGPLRRNEVLLELQ
ncbi:MAG: heme-binding protein [Chromatiaceae bacterium]|nr:MAG: heme-binding protein [Chromatiaceae bacterium]